MLFRRASRPVERGLLENGDFAHASSTDHFPISRARPCFRSSSVFVFDHFEVGIDNAVINADVAVFTAFLLRHFGSSSFVEFG